MTQDAGPEHDLVSLRNFLHDHLTRDVMPFWERFAVDSEGGLNTCIRDDGSIASRDKWLWSQWRAVWVYSRLYRTVEPRQSWLGLAYQIYRFAIRHGWDDDAAGWVLRVDADGRVLDGYESIYVDAFAIYGLAELAAVTGDDEPRRWAQRTAEAVIPKLRRPHDQIPHFPYPIPPGARVHGIPMMFSLVLWELGQLLDDESVRAEALRLSDEVFGTFYRSDRDVILERVRADGGEYPPPEGTAIVPGHVVEDMWFQIHIARDRGDQGRIREAVRLMRRHLELGWDPEFGGMLLAVDADGRPEVGWKFADTKLWWPHTESMYALLLAYEHSREPWCLDWYGRVHRYALSHFPVNDPGEWTQKLTRRGEPFTDTVALPVKDPFHLPRALILCLEVLDRLGGNASVPEGTDR